MKCISQDLSLVKVVNDPLLASDQRWVSLLLLLDYSLATDTTDHTILPDQLQNTAGLKRSYLEWLRSYQSKR